MQERNASRTDGFVVTTDTAHDVKGYYSIQVDARGANFTNTLYDIAEKLLAGELDNARHSLERLWALKKEAQSASNVIVDELIRHYEGKMSALRTREERVLRVGNRSRSLLGEKQRSDKELSAIRKQVEECESAMAELKERLAKLHQRENELASAAARIGKELTTNEREVLGALHDIMTTAEHQGRSAGEAPTVASGTKQPGSTSQTALIPSPQAQQADGEQAGAGRQPPRRSPARSAEQGDESAQHVQRPPEARPTKGARQQPAPTHRKSSSVADKHAEPRSAAWKQAAVRPPPQQTGEHEPRKEQSAKQQTPAGQPLKHHVSEPKKPQQIPQGGDTRRERTKAAKDTQPNSSGSATGQAAKRSSPAQPGSSADTPPPLPTEVRQEAHGATAPQSQSAAGDQSAAKGSEPAQSTTKSAETPDMPPPLPPEARQEAHGATAPRCRSAADDRDAGKSSGPEQSSAKPVKTPDTPPPLPPEATQEGQRATAPRSGSAAKSAAGDQRAAKGSGAEQSSAGSVETPDTPPPLPPEATQSTSDTREDTQDSTPGPSVGGEQPAKNAGDDQAAKKPSDNQEPKQTSAHGAEESSKRPSNDEQQADEHDADDDTAVLRIAADKPGVVQRRQDRRESDDNGGAVILNTAQEHGNLAKSVVKTTSERVLAEYLYDPSVDKNSRHYVLSSRFLLEQLTLGVEMLRTDYDRENHAELVQMLQDSCKRVAQLPNLHFEMSTSDVVNRDALQELSRKLRAKDYDAVTSFCGRLQAKLDALGPNYRRMLVAQMDRLVGRTSTRR